MSRFTKEAILNSFSDMLNKKPFSKITVNDITKACGISRMAFYYHFKDIYDMIDWAITEKLKSAVDKNFTYDTWQQGLTSVFRAVLNEKNFFVKVFPSLDLRVIENYLFDIARGYILGVIDEKSKDMGIDPDEISRNSIAEFYGYSVVGFLLNWVSKGMKEAPEITVERYCFIMKGTLEVTLKRAATKI